MAFYKGYEPYVIDCPYHAILLEQTKPNEPPRMLHCGATIIGPKVAVTVASCFYDKYFNRPRTNKFFLQAGITFRREAGELIEVDHHVDHPEYNPNSTDYDVSLVFLKEPLKFSKNIEPATIPEEPVTPDKIGRVVGFGLTQGRDFKGGITHYQSLRLIGIDAPLYSQEKCVNFYEGQSEEYHVEPERMFCAGMLRGDSEQYMCPGDEGAGFIVDGALHGILAFGLACHGRKIPDVYMNVSVLKNFILENKDQ
ncbi:hypothetical protein Zmor_027907 [Zophobas morio]|uniref:Peptidase S1 domain-containing protein n=1 Tax=Zophobas morio TaxID=2755281 RepID=A0AA38HRV0_9CUCU|nr:hypothetical protein Zmor_027907 [Zophobas morio]